MVTFKIGRFRIGISIFFAAFFAVIIFVSENTLLLYGIFAMLCHELGHFVAMLLSGCPARGFYLLLGRLIIVPARGIAMRRAELPVHLGGIAANFFCAAIFLALGNVTMCLTNAVIAAYNALPAGELDGGAVLMYFLNRTLTPKKAHAVGLAASFAVAFVLFTAGFVMLLKGYANPTLLFSGIYITAQNIRNIRYTK